MSRHYAMIRELIEEGAYDPTTPEGMAVINEELRSPFLPADAAELLAGWALNKRHEAEIKARKRAGGRWAVRTLEVGDVIVTTDNFAATITSIYLPLMGTGRPSIDVHVEGDVPADDADRTYYFSSESAMVDLFNFGG